MLSVETRIRLSILPICRRQLVRGACCRHIIQLGGMNADSVLGWERCWTMLHDLHTAAVERPSSISTTRGIDASSSNNSRCIASSRRQPSSVNSRVGGESSPRIRTGNFRFCRLFIVPEAAASCQRETYRILFRWMSQLSGMHLTLYNTEAYIATSNDMKLVHWWLMGGLLHLVQRGGTGRAAPKLETGIFVCDVIIIMNKDV